MKNIFKRKPTKEKFVHKKEPSNRGIDYSEVYLLFNGDGQGVLESDLEALFQTAGRCLKEPDLARIAAQLENGRLSYSQFISAIPTLEEMSIADMRQGALSAFGIYDIDGSGRVTHEEAVLVLTHLAQWMSREEAEELISFTNQDDSALVDYSLVVDTILSQNK